MNLMSIDTAWAGIIGVVIGALISTCLPWLKDWLMDHERRNLESQRKSYLKKMLENPAHEWRDIQTLSRVIGADKEETIRLLIGLGARGSEAGGEVWALLSKKPLP